MLTGNILWNTPGLAFHSNIPVLADKYGDGFLDIEHLTA